MEKRVKEIMGIVFNTSPDGITNDASPANVDHWDSVNHMNLITALEEEYEVQFTDDQLTEMLTFEGVMTQLKAQL
jgi:acyl carrier protein